MEKTKSLKKNQIAGAVGGIIGFLSYQYVGAAFLFPAIFFVIALFILERKNKGEDKLLETRNLTIALLIGHALWMIIGATAFILTRGTFSQEIIISLIMGVTNLVLVGFIIYNEIPKNTMLVSAVITLVFLLFNLSALTTLGASVFLPLIVLHSVIRLGVIVGCIRYVWLIDTSPIIEAEEEESKMPS